MKTKTFFLLLLSIFLSVCCERRPEDGRFDVVVSKASLTLKYDSAATVSYEAENWSGTVSVSLARGVAGLTVENSFDASSGRGEILFHSVSPCDAQTGICLFFSSGGQTVERPIQLFLYARRPFSASIPGKMELPFGEMMQFEVDSENNDGPVSLSEVRGIPPVDGSHTGTVRYVEELYGISLPYGAIYYDYDEAGGRLSLISTFRSQKHLMLDFIFTDGREESRCSKDVQAGEYVPSAPVISEMSGDRYFFPLDGGAPARVDFVVESRSGVDCLEVAGCDAQEGAALEVSLIEGKYRRSGTLEIRPAAQWEMPESRGSTVTITLRAGNAEGYTDREYEMEPFYFGLGSAEREWVEEGSELEPQPITSAEIRDGFDVYCPEKPEVIFEDDSSDYLSYGYGGDNWTRRQDDRGQYWIVSFNRAANDTGSPRTGHVQVRVLGGRYVLRLKSVQDG